MYFYDRSSMDLERNNYWWGEIYLASYKKNLIINKIRVNIKWAIINFWE